MSFQKVCDILRSMVNLYNDDGYLMKFYEDEYWCFSADAAQNDEITSLIESEYLYNAVDESNNTLLHHAATYGNHVILQFLVDSHSQVDNPNAIDAKNDLGQTPLVSALKSEYCLSKKVIAVLLQAYADTYERDNLGESAWSMVNSSEWLMDNTCRFGILKVFLKNTGDLDDFPILKRGNERVIELLLETDIDLLMADADGTILAHMLAQNSNPGVMALLRDENLDINLRDESGWTALMHAATGTAVKALELLLDEGAEIEATCDLGQTALYIACDDSHGDRDKKCVQLLLERGANAQVEATGRDATTIFDLDYDYFELRDLIAAHLALQEASGVAITRLIRSKIESCGKLKAYYEYSKQQLSMEIHCSITLFDVLTVNERRLERYLRDKELVSKLTIQMIDYYDTMQRKRLSKALLMTELRKTAARVVGELVKIDYNRCPIIADEIASYLDEKDIKCLISIEGVTLPIELMDGKIRKVVEC